MMVDLRFNAFLISLAAASLCSSAAANAGPSQTPANNRPTTAPAVTRPHFPESLTVDGKRYDRLTGASLEQAVRGKTFCPSAPCSGIDGSVEVFRDDGAYL